MTGVYRSRPWPALAFSVVTINLLAWTGCESKREVGPEPAPPPMDARQKDPFLAGTIGAKTLLGSAEREELRGYGLVVGLGENGSSDCPTLIRDYLMEFMKKQYSPKDPADYKKQFSPGDLIDSLDTAVVEVHGSVAPASPKGARFDLVVMALSGTSTRSLEGGLLLPTELRLYTGASDKESLASGQVLAEAGGPVYINPTPPDEADKDAVIDPRQGLVLGGGKTMVERTTRLVLLEASSATARRIEQRLNERFGQKPPTAEPTSQSFLTLHTPPSYQRRPRRFLDLAIRVPLETNPAYLDMRLNEMTRIMKTPDGNHEQAALAMESLGRRALSAIQSFYASEKPAVRFYAALSGLHLGDASAVDILGEIAASRSPERLRATIELGESDLPQAAIRLVALLDSTDQQVRITAYEGLLNHRHPAVESRAFACMLDGMQTNMWLDIVQSSGKPLIFVRQTKVPRIAVFGRTMPVTTPMFVSLADDSVTINGHAGGDVGIRSKYRVQVPSEFSVPPRVVDLICTLAELPRGKEAISQKSGCGLPYSRVVQVLYLLTRDGTIPATLAIQASESIDSSKSEGTPERPEADEPGAMSDETPPREESPRDEK